jgi:hypothetical protein
MNIEQHMTRNIRTKGRSTKELKISDRIIILQPLASMVLNFSKNVGIRQGAIMKGIIETKRKGTSINVWRP